MKGNAVKFICVFMCILIAAAGILCVAAYCLDPQNVYRFNDSGKRYYNQLYSTASAVRNYDYDYLLIGSSMMQNFDAETFSNSLGCKPLKLTVGALTAPELMWLYNCAQEQGKAKTYVINIDLHRFASCEDVNADSGRFKEYMYNPSGISQFKYLLGYETWLRFIPLQLGLTVLDKLNVNLPSSFATATDINAMASWDDSKMPGAEKLQRDFIENKVVFNDGSNDEFSARACENMSNYLALLENKLDGDEKIVIYLPAYSALYWAEKSKSQLETLFELRRIIGAFAAEYDDVHLLDMQADTCVADLDLYVDASHYGEGVRKIAEQKIIACAGEPSAEEIEQNNVIIKNYAKSARDKAQALK